jgi:hypothetical protein
MNCPQNHKIYEVSDQTHVVGMDIAKRKHYACSVDIRKRVLQMLFPSSSRNKALSNVPAHS